jgi:hypothetical protein
MAETHAGKKYAAARMISSLAAPIASRYASSMSALLLSNRLTPMHQGFVEPWHAAPFGFIFLLAARLP